MNPYRKPIAEIKEITRKLIALASCPDLDLHKEEGMSRFRNIAAVYCVWQEDLHLAQAAAMNWDLSKA